MLNQLYEQQVLTDNFSLSNQQATDNIDLQYKQERTKLWDLDHNYHCAIIGTCLTLDEVKKLLRSFQIPIKDACSYDLHTTIVTLISYNDFRSRKVQSYLNKKFKIAVQKTKKMTATELIQEWKRVLNNDELISTFWAILLHPRTNEQMKRDCYGAIHMQSHMSGASNRVDLKRLTQLEKEQNKVDLEKCIQQDKFQQLQADNTCLQQKIQQQTEASVGLSNQVNALTNANEQLSILKGANEIEHLNIQLTKWKGKYHLQSTEIERLKNSQQQSSQALSTLKQQINADKKTIIEYKNEIEHLHYVLSQNKTEDKCLFKKQGLCGQCVLYVGGKTSLVPYYRDLIEAKSGVFLHHDGGIEKSTQNLAQALNRADVVIFPSECLSHDAYWKIKDICKKQQKPFEYLKSPGLHSLSNILDKITSENQNITELD